jgi:GAF domain-containing protein/HAMP domain-containing protein
VQNFLKRFVWRNLSVRAKTGLLFFLQVVVVLSVAVLSVGVLNAVSNRVRRASDIALQMGSLSRDLQLQVEDLQRFETRLSSSYQEATFFDPEVSEDYIEHIDLARQTTAKLRSLSREILSPEAQATVDEDLINIEMLLVQLETDSLSTRNLSSQLLSSEVHAPEGGMPSGILNRVDWYGNSLQVEIIVLGRGELIDQVLLLRRLERALMASGAESDKHSVFQVAESLRTAVNQEELLYTDQVKVLTLLDSYLEQVSQAGDQLAQLNVNHENALLSFTQIRNTASRMSLLFEKEAESQLLAAQGVQIRSQFLLAGVVVVALLIDGGLIYFFSRELTRRIEPLLEATTRLQDGELQARVDLEGEDEFTQLALGFNAMAVQLDGLVGGLEQRVAERTRDLTITAEIGQAVVERSEPRDLMNEIVELIRVRFGFYHAQVFLVDDDSENANLVASTGKAGRELLARHHALPVGSQSVIGQVTESGKPVIALDTDTDRIHRRNELLPDTRSEMALPMRIGDKIIGALDVQSVAPNAFDEDNVAVFQIMADQLAIALENARLANQLVRLMDTIAALQQQATQRDWQIFQQDLDPNKPVTFQIEGDEVNSPDDPASSEILDTAIQSGHSVVRKNGDDGINFAIPIRVRGVVIGAFGFGGESLDDLSDEDMGLIEAVIDRVGLALENLRLIGASSRRAEYEQLVNEITAKIVGSTDVDFILQTTVQELGRVLRAPQTSVQLRQDSIGSGNHE